jgi:prohibitin 2
MPRTTDDDSSPKPDPIMIGRFRLRSVVLGVLAGILLISVFAFIKTGVREIDSTERAVVYTFGGDLTIRSPDDGRYQWVTPVLDEVTFYDVRSDTYKEIAEGIAEDQQTVTTEVTVLYHPSETKIQTIHQTLGRDYERKVVVPAVQDSVKSVMNHYEVEQLKGDVRDLVKAAIVQNITAALESKNLVVDQISLTDFDFGHLYNEATEQAAVEQRNVEKARAIQERARIEANTTVITAQANYEAARLLAATQSDALYQFKWLEVWDKNGSPMPQVLVMGEGGNTLLPLPLAPPAK